MTPKEQVSRVIVFLLLIMGLAVVVTALSDSLGRANEREVKAEHENLLRQASQKTEKAGLAVRTSFIREVQDPLTYDLPEGQGFVGFEESKWGTVSLISEPRGSRPATKFTVLKPGLSNEPMKIRFYVQEH